MTDKTFWLVDADDDVVIDRDVDLGAFFVLNDVTPDEANRIGEMDPGDEMMFGGGAGCTFVLRRTV